MVNRLLVRCYSSAKVVVCANGAVASWHPRQDTPFEHTRPIDLSKQESVAYTNKRIARKEGPDNSELKEIFYTTKHEWFTRTREERLRSVAAPLPKKD